MYLLHLERGKVLKRVELLTLRFLDQSLQLARLLDLTLNTDFVVFALRHDPEWPRARVSGANPVWLDHIFVPFGVLVDSVREAFNVIDVLHRLR